MSLLRSFGWLAAALLVLQLAPVTLLAQAVTGTIHGSVSDTTGARAPAVTVTVIQVGTGERRTATTDETGGYVFPVLAVGEYRLEVEHRGFKKFVQHGLLLSVNSNVRVDPVLEVGAVSEEVRIVADATMVDTREAQIGGLVDTRRINDLPLNGRNVYDLVSILPGVAATRFLVTPDNQGNSINVNGSRSFHSTYMLDGGFNNDLFRNSGNAAPNPDAVQEFRLITSNFSAEFGRNSGAVLNVITKSGTNDLHGSLFEFLRNDVLNARNFFQPTVSSLRQNQFGATGGGRIIRNRTFFFGSYQGLRIRNGVFQNNALPPTAAERTGNFSAAAAAQRPVDPTNGQAFPGGIIPANRLDPVAANIVNTKVPLPNTPDGRLQVSAPRTSNEDQWLGKIDHQLSSRHKLYGSLFVLHGKSVDPYAAANQIPTYSPATQSFHQRNVVVNEEWTVSPSVLNQLRFSYTRRLWDTSVSDRTTWKDFGSKVTLGSEPGRPPQIIVNGRWQMGQNTEFHQPQHSLAWSDTVSWVHGNHTLKAGTWLIRNKYREITNWLGSGQVRFSGNFTRNSLADLMIGMAASFRQNNAPDRDFRSLNWHSFVQDDWRIHRRLTVNLGLRYELNTPFSTPDDSVQTFRFNTQSKVIPKAPLGLVFPGDSGIPSGLVPTDRNNFAPRIGFALDVFGNGKTAIRAGYGFFYSVPSETFANSMQGQPFLADVTVFGTPNLVDPWANVPGGSPFPYKFDRSNPLFSLPVTASWLNGELATPYVQQYNFTVEQQLMKDLSLQAAYVGNTSRKFISQRDANSPVFIPGRSTAANVNDRRPYLPGTFAQISDIQSAANGHYDSLQVAANRRFSGGFSVLTSYTLAKSIDEAPDDVQNNTDTMMQDSNNRKAERAASNFDTRHVFIASYMWQLPAVPRWGFAGRQILSGWSINGITRADSGSRFNVVLGTDANLDGISTYDRPNLLGDPKLSRDRPRDELIAKYFNTAAFGRVASGSLGTAGRNLLYGPGAINWNFSIFKNFPIREQRRVQFRAEFFNVFNHTNLGNPNTNMSNANFGRILSAGGARVVQFGIKLIY
ncbi:MAG: carboxypeptidase regulatory-like domain-containing protein [Bryobacteraceae bacterium]